MGCPETGRAAHHCAGGRETLAFKDRVSHGLTSIQNTILNAMIVRIVMAVEKFGDLITADDKVLNEGGESRNNHRYAVVVQDLDTHWIQSHPFKQKLLRRREEVYGSFLSVGKAQSHS